MKRIDLHVHSSQSDGTYSPTELVLLAKRSGLTAFALTDHDTTDGVEEAVLAGVREGIEVAAGIEFSTEFARTDVHIIGLDMDYRHPGFQEQLSYFREERLRRNQKMIRQMAADGIRISFSQMTETFGETVWTRAHFARFLLSNGYVSTVSEAFDRYLGEDCPYYVPREKVSPAEVTRLIRQYNGIPILAHPLLYHFPEETLRKLLGILKSEGLLGMEIFYSTHSSENEQYLASLASCYQLLPSGGSDFHGSNKPEIQLGTGQNNLCIPYAVLENLRLASSMKQQNEIDNSQKKGGSNHYEISGTLYES